MSDRFAVGELDAIRAMPFSSKGETHQLYLLRTRVATVKCEKCKRFTFKFNSGSYTAILADTEAHERMCTGGMSDTRIQTQKALLSTYDDMNKNSKNLTPKMQAEIFTVERIAKRFIDPIARHIFTHFLSPAVYTDIMSWGSEHERRASFASHMQISWQDFLRRMANEKWLIVHISAKMELVKKFAREKLGMEIYAVLSGVTAKYNEQGQLLTDHLEEIHSILRQSNANEELVTKEMLKLELMRAIGPVAMILKHVFRRVYENIGFKVMHDDELMVSEDITECFHNSYSVSPTVYINIFSKQVTDLLNGNKADKVHKRYWLQSNKLRD